VRAVPPKRPRARTAEQVKTSYVALSGGEDLVSPALSINPGALMFSENYEPGIVYGYRRIDGFERSDGQPLPSDASYWIISFTAGDNEPSIGATVIGATSGATGALLAVVVSSGAWATNDAAGYLVLSVVSGTFANAETLQFSQPAAFSSGFSGGFA
jgi:hypothetical protein